MTQRKLPKRTRDLMQKHRLAPGFLSQREVMNKLQLGRDYQKFYRLFYRATMQEHEA